MNRCMSGLRGQVFEMCSPLGRDFSSEEHFVMVDHDDLSKLIMIS